MKRLKSLVLIMSTILLSLPVAGCNGEATNELSPGRAACIGMLQQVPVYYEDFQFWDVAALREDPKLEEMYRIWHDRNLDSLEERYALDSGRVDYLARSEGLSIIKTGYDAGAVRDSISQEFYRDTSHEDMEVWKSEPSHDPEHVTGGWVLADGMLVRGINNGNVDDYLRVAGGAELSMYDENTAGLLAKLPEGVTARISRTPHPKGLVVSGISVAITDNGTFRWTNVYRFDNAAAAVSDEANEYFGALEGAFNKTVRELEAVSEPPPLSDFSLVYDGEFVTWSVSVAEENMIFMLFYD